MNQSYKCPICGKDGIPNFRKEDVVCPCCSSDLSIYNRLREVTEIQPSSHPGKLRNKWLWSVLVCVLIVALMVFACITNYKITLKEESLKLKEVEIITLKREITLLRDRIISKPELKDGTIGKETSGYRIYIIQPGEGLRTISRKQLGKESRFNEIETLNQLESGAIIHPGDTLILPDK